MFEARFLRLAFKAHIRTTNASLHPPMELGWNPSKDDILFVGQRMRSVTVLYCTLIASTLPILIPIPDCKV